MSYISHLRKKIGHETIIMPCACLLLHDGNGHILLQKRKDDGLWGYHGGAIEVDESVEEALQREIHEELSITLNSYSLLGIYSGKQYHHIYPNGDEVSSIDIVYVSNDWTGIITKQDEEVEDLKWFSYDQLPDSVTQNLKQPMMDFVDQLTELKKR